jgi:hypothetical protein
LKTPSAVISFSAQSQTAVLPIPLRQRAPPGFGNPHPERPRPPVVDSGDLAADAGDGNQRPAQIAAPRTARRPARRSRGREASGGAVLNTFKVEAGANCIVFGPGGIGLNVIQRLRLAGADKIIGVDINPDRRSPRSTPPST